MNSRRLAQAWPFPKYQKFEQQLRQSASDWFVSNGFRTHPKMPYCLSEWSDWKQNIILEEVSTYIEQVKVDCEKDGRPFPLHKYIHHGLSSQAMAFNLVGPLITRNDYAPLAKLLHIKNQDTSTQIKSASFEYEDRSVFNEDSGQPTSIDIVLKDGNSAPVIFMESKLAEREFGGCSVFDSGDCNGENPIANKSQCYLHFIGRKYWELMEKHGFTDMLQQERQCVFVAHYQFFREVLFTLENGGTFVLLSDERSPVFHCEVNGMDKGLIPFLMTFVPSQLAHKVIDISVQELVAQIKETKAHSDWIHEFEQKYGLEH